MDVSIRTLKASTSPSETQVIDSRVWIELSGSETKWVDLCVNLREFSLLVWGAAWRSENRPHFGFTAAVTDCTTETHRSALFIQRHPVWHAPSRMTFIIRHYAPRRFWVGIYSRLQKFPEHRTPYKHVHHGLQFPQLHTGFYLSTSLPCYTHSTWINTDT